MNVMSHFTKSSIGGLKYNDFEKELAKGRKASPENLEVQSITYEPVGTH
jgi:hypothetical protein